MPAGVSWGQYVKFTIAATLAMTAGSQTVHIYYKPLKDLNVYVERELEAQGVCDHGKKKRLSTTFFHKFGTIYRPHLLQIEQEYCQFLKNRTSSKTLQHLQTMWQDAGNFLDPCPIKGRTYAIDLAIESDQIPMEILPAGDWRLDSISSTIINNTKIKLASVSEFYEIKLKSALQWK